MKKLIIFVLLFLTFNINVSALYEIDFELNSDKAIVINTTDNIILYEKNAREKTQIASLTKIVTAITVIENTEDLDKEIIITYDMLKSLDGYAKAGFYPGCKVSIKDLLYALMLPSAADSAQALAISTSGSISAFADLMNEEVKKIGVDNTHFTNPVGMDSDLNYSTAYDLYKILEYSLKNDIFKELYEAKEYYIKSIDKNVEKTIVVTSKDYDIDISIIKGAKTGYTDLAGMCLSSTATLNGIDYMVIVLNADTKTIKNITDTLNLYNYYNDNFGYIKVVDDKDLFKILRVRDSKQKKYEIKSLESISRYLKKDINKEDFKIDYSGVEEIDNKFKNGDLLGTISISYDDEVLYETKVYYDGSIKFYDYKLYNICVLIFTVIFLYFLLRKKHK